MSSFDKGINKDLAFGLLMEEGSGNPFDSGKLHLPLTKVNNPVWTTSGVKNTNVLEFYSTATQDYYSIPRVTAASLNFTTQNFTLMCWVKYHTVPSGFISIFSFTNGGNRGYLWYFIANILTLQTGDAGGAVTANSVANAFLPNIWYLFAATKTGTAGINYVNGVDKSNTTTAKATIVAETVNDFLFAEYNSGVARNMDGQLYFPRIWSRALSPQEIWYLFQRERRLFEV